MDKQEAIKKWSELYGRQISEEEYDEICRNLSGFFGLLHEWDREARNKEASNKNT